MPSPRSSRGRTGSPPRLALAAIAVAAVAWLGAAIALRATHGGRILPGTTMSGVSLGGATLADAARRLDVVVPPRREVLVDHRGTSVTISSTSLAFRLDARRSAERALEAGRSVFGFLGAPAAALGYDRVIEPVYALDRRRLERVIAALVRRVALPPFPGSVTIDPVTLAARVEPPRNGRRVLRRAAARAVERALLSAAPNRLTLPVRPARGPSLDAVERVASEAVAYLAAGRLRLVGAGPPISLGASDLAPLLTVVPDDAARGASIRLGVDEAAARALLESVAERRARPARNARIVAPAAAVTVEGKGDVEWRPRPAGVEVRPARHGRAVDVAGSLRRMGEAVAAGRHELALAVRPIPPRLTTTPARRVRNLIGTFTTRFACCEPRVVNIRLMAQAIDGVVVAPGQQFSLNGAAGPRTPGRGFVPAPFISDGKIVPSVGGGVSQLSTTVYNAAYFAGLQLDAHQPHSFYIDRYPAGREATLDYATIDLTWTNDTTAPVLLRASTTDTSVTVSLFGANGQRRVSADAGARRPVPGRDFAITVTRTIRHRGGRVVRQPHTTTYDEPPAP